MGEMLSLIRGCFQRIFFIWAFICFLFWEHRVVGTLVIYSLSDLIDYASETCKTNIMAEKLQGCILYSALACEWIEK